MEFMRAERPLMDISSSDVATMIMIENYTSANNR